MFNLIRVIFDTSNGFEFIIVELISIASLLFGICVINSKNPIVSVLFLIGLFVSISLNLIFIGFKFIGLSYLLVYVGAISILFLFILMLINIRISELLNDTNNGVPLAIYTGFSFCFPIYLTLISTDSLKEKSKNTKSILDILEGSTSDKSHPSNIRPNTTSMIEISEDSIIEISAPLNPFQESIASQQLETNLYQSSMDVNSDLQLVYSNTWDNNLTNTLDITSIGNVLYSTYGIWLLISSIILLLAMIGAITITKKEKI